MKHVQTAEDLVREAAESGELPGLVYLPTAEEIAAACREIRKTWSREERKARWAIPIRWTCPEVKVSQTGQADTPRGNGNLVRPCVGRSVQ